jgi:hypothetical protein
LRFAVDELRGADGIDAESEGREVVAIGMHVSSTGRRPMRRRFGANFPIYEDSESTLAHTRRSLRNGALQAPRSMKCYRELRIES